MTTKQFKNFTKKIPAGDDRQRLVCNSCNFIHYDNPKVITGAVVTYKDHFLLCKRAIQPQKGLWTVPAGFMEMGETPSEGAQRETFEEAKATITPGPLIGIYTIKHISQVQMFYHAVMETPDFAPGIESQDVQLFKWSEIPWKFIAFPSIKWALEDYAKVAGSKNFPPFSRTFDLENHAKS